MNYKYKGTSYTLEGLEEEIREDLEWSLEYNGGYDEILNDIYPLINFGDLTYEPSLVLRKVDPIAYREGWIGYVDSLMSDIMSEIEMMDDEEIYHLPYGKEWVECYGEEQENEI